MGLLVGEHLHAVFESAQEAIGIAQALHATARDKAELLARGQRRQQSARAQRRFAATADQLHELDDEFDLADAARTELQMIGQILARDFGVDQRLHLAQAGERGVVEIAPEYERAQCVEQLRARVAVAGDRARLDPCVAFPIAAFTLEILLHRSERKHQTPGLAEWTQAQIDAIDIAVGIAIGEQRDQRLTDAHVIRTRIERARSIAVAVLGEREHEIDIRREIEFAATELAEREHDQPLWLAVRRAHAAVARCNLALGAAQRGFQTALGEHGSAGQGCFHRIRAVNVAPDQAQRLTQAKPAQRGAKVRVVSRLPQHARPRIRVTRIAHQLQQFRTQQVWIAQETFVGEIAGQKDALQMIVHAGVVVERHAGLAAGDFQARQTLVDEYGRGAWPLGRLEHGRLSQQRRQTGQLGPTCRRPRGIHAAFTLSWHHMRRP